MVCRSLISNATCRSIPAAAKALSLAIRIQPRLELVAIAAYVSPGLAAFCGGAILVIWALCELIGVCGSRFFHDD